MSFRFVIERASRLAGTLILDGVLEEGTLLHGTRAHLDLPTGRVEIVLKTVAFVRSKAAESNALTLTVDGYTGDLRELVGAMLNGT